MAIQWSVPDWAWPLLLVVAAGAVAFSAAVYARTGPDPGRRVRRALVTLRGLTLAVLVLAIAGPVTSCLRPRLQPAEIVLVAEDSASMALADQAPGPGWRDDGAAAVAADRWQRALGALGHVDSLLSREHPDVRRTWLRGNGLQPLQEFGPAGSAVPPPTRHGTSFPALARRLREHIAGRPVRAVVLVSDGAETDRGDTGGVLANAAAALPLRVLGVGPDADLADRAVVDVRFPENAYAGQEVAVEFAVVRTGGGRDEAPLVVSLHDGEALVATDTLRSPGDLTPARLVYRPAGEGLAALRVEASALVNERFLGNNSVSFAVDVRRDRLRVLVVAAVPGWDTRFLAVAAAAEPRLALTTAYPAARGLVLADSLRDWRPPRDAAGWASWDAVIVTGWGDDRAGLDWASLAAAVDAGMGLLVLPSAAAGRGGEPLAAGPPGPLAAVLPVTAAPWRWVAGPRFAAPTPEGLRHPVLEGLDGARAGQALAGLPPWREVVAAEAGAEAVVLLEAMAPGGGPGLPALAVTGRGQGRVAWFGVRQAWEWAFWEPSTGPGGGDSQPARRALRNLLVWLAEGDGAGGLQFATRPGARQEGQPVRIAARWRDLRGDPVTGRMPGLELRPTGPGADTTALRTFEMAAVPGQPGDSEVEVPPLAPGRYSLRLLAAGDPPVAGAAAELLVTDTSVESAQVRQDRSRLEQLAARAGGTYRDLGEAGTLAALDAELLALDWTGSEDRQRRRLDLWSGWPFIAAVMTMLGTEWFLRRRHGLL